MAPTKRKTDAKRVASCSSAPDSKLDMDLARVIGMSQCRSGGLACSPGTGDVAHPAGAVVVIYSPARDAQIMFLRAPKPNAGVKEARAIRPSATTRDTRSTNASAGTQGGGKPFVSVAFSGTRGRFIAAGEKGHQPAAVVWSAETGKPLAVLRGHRYGVEAIAFCPGHDDRRVVTLGADNDGHVALWDWREGVNLARHFCGHDVSSGRLRSVAFNADGDSFVTAGAAHLKVWRVGSNSTRSGPHSHHDESKFHAKYRRLGGKSDGKVFGLVECGSKSADVGGHASHTWVAVCAPPPHVTHTAVSAPSAPTDTPCEPADAVTYALSEEGVLCMLRGGSRVERWVDTRVTRGGALALGGEHVAVAAGDGVVRLFRVGTLAYRGTLPRPVRVGGHDEPETLDEVCETSPPPGVSFPDAIACAFDTDGTALTVAYSDRSVFVWDTKNVANVRRLRVFFAHSGSVFGEFLFFTFVLSIPLIMSCFVYRRVSSAGVDEGFDGATWHVRDVRRGRKRPAVAPRVGGTGRRGGRAG
jgi:WD40 repeat protein